jgi:hypothetical protein
MLRLYKFRIEENIDNAKVKIVMYRLHGRGQIQRRKETFIFVMTFILAVGSTQHPIR